MKFRVQSHLINVSITSARFSLIYDMNIVYKTIMFITDYSDGRGKLSKF